MGHFTIPYHHLLSFPHNPPKPSQPHHQHPRVLMICSAQVRPTPQGKLSHPKPVGHPPESCKPQTTQTQLDSKLHTLLMLSPHKGLKDAIDNTHHQYRMAVQWYEGWGASFSGSPLCVPPVPTSHSLPHITPPSLSSPGPFSHMLNHSAPRSRYLSCILQWQSERQADDIHTAPGLHIQGS